MQDLREHSANLGTRFGDAGLMLPSPQPRQSRQDSLLPSFAFPAKDMASRVKTLQKLQVAARGDLHYVFVLIGQALTNRHRRCVGTV